jgi:hypothetical protein
MITKGEKDKAEAVVPPLLDSTIFLSERNGGQRRHPCLLCGVFVVAGHHNEVMEGLPGSLWCTDIKSRANVL